MTLQSTAGIVTFVALAWLISENRRKVRVKVVCIGIVLQLAVGFVLLKLPLFEVRPENGFKYRLGLVVNGNCLIRYDNEAGKGDHKHIGANFKTDKIELFYPKFIAYKIK